MTKKLCKILAHITKMVYNNNFEKYSNYETKANIIRGTVP